jgi:hypothetical protein
LPLVQLDEIIRTDCTVMVLEVLDGPVLAPVEPAPVEPEAVEPELVAPAVDEPLPIELPEALLSVPRTSTWWPTCFCSAVSSDTLAFSR